MLRHSEIAPRLQDDSQDTNREWGSALFWHDNWGNQPLLIAVPELFSFAKNKLISVHKALSEAEFTELFQLPLSQPTFLQLQNIQPVLDNMVISDDTDRSSYSWGTNVFASTKVYRVLFGHSIIHPTLKWLWKKQCQPKHKVFFWLLIMDRLSTRNLFKKEKHASRLL